MSRILVSGLINLETTLRVDHFPLAYEPVRYPFFGVNSTISGVGYNVAKALTTLGHETALLSLIGDDLAGAMVWESLANDGIDDRHILAAMPATAQSVILYDTEGKRQVHTDLKDIQDRTYPTAAFNEALTRCALAVLCNINYNRPFLAAARRAGVPIATDVHTVAEIEDGYNRDFMAAADILFLSDERLPGTPEQFARHLQDRYATAVIVIGLGDSGALLAINKDNFMERLPAVSTRPIVNTIGAGDALFSAFLHGLQCELDPVAALRQAQVFASYKIGATGAAQGFLTAVELQDLTAALDAR